MMKRRLRWYKIEPFTRQNLKSLAVKLGSKPFSEDGPVGFLLDESTDEFILGRLIERSESLKQAISPLGTVSNYTVVSYCETTFKISTSWPTLEISTGFKNTGELLNQLSIALRFDVIIEDEIFEIRSFISNLKKNTRSLKVVSLTIKNLQIDSSTSAHVEVTSTSDALAESRDLVGRRKHELQKVKCEWLDGPDICSAFLSTEGHIAISAPANSDAWENVLTAARESRK